MTRAHEGQSDYFRTDEASMTIAGNSGSDQPNSDALPDAAVHARTSAHHIPAGDGETGYHLAVVLDATGRRAEAKTVLQSVIAKGLEFNDRDNAKQLLARW